MKNSVDVTKACFDAYVKKDKTAIELLINDEFSFTSPLDNRIDRETYFKRCWPNSKDIAEFKFVYIAPLEDRVFVVYEGKNFSGKVFRNTEIFTVRNEKITEVEVYFGWNLPHKAPEHSFLAE